MEGESLENTYLESDVSKYINSLGMENDEDQRQKILKQKNSKINSDLCNLRTHHKIGWRSYSVDGNGLIRKENYFGVKTFDGELRNTYYTSLGKKAIDLVYELKAKTGLVKPGDKP